jgi:hypothetical protein
VPELLWLALELVEFEEQRQKQQAVEPVAESESEWAVGVVVAVVKAELGKSFLEDCLKKNRLIGVVAAHLDVSGRIVDKLFR